MGIFHTAIHNSTVSILNSHFFLKYKNFINNFKTKRSFLKNRPVQIWYFVKCIYFGYSSRQIRCGYPTRILGNFLTKGYSYVNLVLFKGFLLVPFLLELRSLMDWYFIISSTHLYFINFKGFNVN